VQDIDRLFHHVARMLLATNPERLQQPVSISELISTLVPYRTSRRSLGVDSSEDYELLLLRFASGEGGFAHTQPDPVRLRFANEVRSPNPDLSVLREFRDAVFILQPAPLARMLTGASEDDAFVPPARAPEPPPVEHADEVTGEAAVPDGIEEQEEHLPLDVVRSALPYVPEPEVAPAPAETPVATAQCSYCGGSLPAGRAIHFCPHCGQPQTLGQCPRCKAEVEYGWRHCVSCGTALSWGG
jgi:hypothetical protein